MGVIPSVVCSNIYFSFMYSCVIHSEYVTFIV